jgi:peptidoglycan/LPS O-acetylase OafA/YrhL
MAVLVAQTPDILASPAVQPAAQPARLISLDSWKALAVMAIVVRHVNPFLVLDEIYPTPFGQLYYMCWLAANFAVPFFLLSSGYLFGQALQRGRSATALFWRKARRLVPLFLGWSMVYALAPRLRREMPSEGLWASLAAGAQDFGRLLIEEPVQFVLYGTKAHLWFVSALLAAFGVVALLAWMKRARWLLPLGVACFFVGWVGKLSMAPADAGPLGFDPRKSVLYTLLFIALGIRAAAWPQRIWTRRFAFGLIIGGLALIPLGVLLRAHFLGDRYYAGFFLGEVPLGLGVLALALRYPTWGQGTALPKIGQMTLGIYLAHILVMDWLIPHRYNMPPVLWDLTLDALVIGLTIGLVALLRRWRVTAFFVR